MADWRGMTVLASRKTTWIAAGAIVASLILAVSLIRLSAQPAALPGAVATPATDPLMAAYRAMVNDDVNTIDVLEFHKLTCKTRDLCISQMQDLRAATESLIGDLDRKPVPHVLAQQGAAVQGAARQVLARIDEVLTLMRQSGTDYVKLSAGVDLHPLEEASGNVVCWPGKPVFNELGESAVGYVCGR